MDVAHGHLRQSAAHRRSRAERHGRGPLRQISEERAPPEAEARDEGDALSGAQEEMNVHT